MKAPLRPRREWAAAALTFLLSLAASLAIGEAAVRLWKRDVAFQPDPDLIRSLRPDRDEGVDSFETEANLSSLSNEIPRHPTRFISHTNNLGLRMRPDVGPKAPGEKRVLLLGDSYTEALYTPQEQCFYDLVDARLRSASPGPGGWRLLNGGIQNGCPSQYLLQLRKFLPELQPDVVVVLLAPNDLSDDSGFERGYGYDLDPQGIPVAPRARTQLWLLQKSYLLRYLEVLLARFSPGAHDQLFPPAAPGTPVPDWKLLLCSADPAVQELYRRKTGRYLRRLKEMAEAQGARFGVLLIHYLYSFDDEPFYEPPQFPGLKADLARHHCREAGARLYNEFIEGFLAEAGIPYRNTWQAFLDAKRESPKRKLWHFYDYHFSPAGHRVMAAELYAFLQSFGISG